jgi:hypothetical protein
MKAQIVSYCVDHGLMRSDFVWLTLPDDSIREILPILEALDSEGVGPQWVIPSGSLSTTLLQAHPLFTFPFELYDSSVYASIPWGLNLRAQQALHHFPWIERHFLVPHGQETLYHALAVLSANAPQILWSKLHTLASTLGLSLQDYGPLMTQSLQNSLKNPNAITGPFVRGDFRTLALHRQALKDFPELQMLYPLLQKLIPQKDSRKETPHEHS